MKKLCVIGSINMDLVASVERFPKPGETITGTAFGNYPGGKGANQAVALGRLGAEVAMIGKVGDDVYGTQYLKVFKDNSVKTEGIQVEKGISSGIAVIEVEATGENHIIVIPGANGLVDKQFIDDQFEYLKQYDIFLFQLEVPIDTVAYAMKRLKEQNKTIILDPAPARTLPEEIFTYVDYITPNETEIQILTGRKITSEGELKEAAGILQDKGVKTVIAKAGKRGAYIIKADYLEHVPGFKVEAIDTTAAGDSFNGGFAFSLARGNDMVSSVRFANAVAALSTMALGAQGAMPTLEQVNAFINKD